MNSKKLNNTACKKMADSQAVSHQAPLGSAKPYETPTLICYGDVRDVTLGPTLGAGESGCEGLFRVGPGGCPI